MDYKGFLKKTDDYQIVEIYTPLFDCDGYCGDVLDYHLIGRGYAVIEKGKFDPEKIFDLCNWSCWTDEKPANLYSDIDVISHGLVVKDPNSDNFYLALSNGWHMDSKEGIEGKIASYDTPVFWG